MMGVYGGTFDPVHHGHLRTAIEVKEGIGLNELRLVPCRRPPHRPRPAASGEQRLRMLQMAVPDDSGLKIDPQELLRPGPSYTVDTLNSLRTEIGQSTPLCLIVGGDAFAGLPTWHRWRQLFELAHLVVVRRPASPVVVPDDLAPIVAKRQSGNPASLKACPAGLIFFFEVTQLDISASRIRGLIKAGKSPRFLLPESVWAFIQRQELYQ